MQESHDHEKIDYASFKKVFSKMIEGIFLKAEFENVAEAHRRESVRRLSVHSLASIDINSL